MEQHIGWKVGEKPDSKEYIELVIHGNNKVSMFMTNSAGATSSVTMFRESAVKVIKDFAETLGMKVQI